VPRYLAPATGAALLLPLIPMLVWVHEVDLDDGDDALGWLARLMIYRLMLAIVGSVVGCVMTRRWIGRASVVVSSIVAWLLPLYAEGLLHLFKGLAGLALFLGLPLVAPLVVATLFRVRERALDAHGLRF
jgi:hypothetical protein